MVTPRDARREVGEAVEPHLQVLARLASEEELLAADGRVDWLEVGVGVRVGTTLRVRARDLGFEFRFGLLSRQSSLNPSPSPNPITGVHRRTRGTVRSRERWR